MTAKTDKQLNFARLREKAERAQALLEGVDDILIGHTVLESGYHPLKAGRGLTEILVRRHRSQPHPPWIPDISQSDVVALADELGINPQFEPTRRLEI